MGGGGSFRPWGEGGANNRMYYSLFVNGPVTGGTSKWGKGGLITGCNYFCRCLQVKWVFNWGNL